MSTSDPSARPILAPVQQAERIQIVEAARRRQRQVVMSPGGFGLWLKQVAPGWMDKLTVQRFLKPVAK